MKIRLFYEVVIECEDQLACDNLSMGIEQLLSETEGVNSAMITVEEVLKK